MNNDTSDLRKVINSLLVERMTKWTEDPWLVSVKNITVTAPESEGGLFQLKDKNIKITLPNDKQAFNSLFNMGIPDPVADEMRLKAKKNKAKQNPWVNPDGSMSDEEYEDEWGRTMTPAKRFKEMEINLAAQKAYDAQLEKKKLDADLLKKNQSSNTMAYESLRKLVKNIIKEEFVQNT